MNNSLELMPRSGSRRRGVLLRTSVVVLSLLCTLICFELGFRLLPIANAKASILTDRPRRYYLPSGTRDNRNYSYQESKPSGIFRIIVLGDSFTYAADSQFDDNFVKRLERMLNMQQSGLRAEVLNWGQPGYSTVHEARLMRRALQYAPDLIILQVTLNDPEVHPYSPVLKQKRERLNQAMSVWPLRFFTSLNFIANRIFNSLSHREYGEYYFDLFENPETWKTFSSASREILGMAQEAHVPILAAIFPLFSHPFDSDYPFREIHQKILQFYKEISFPAIDLLRFYRDAAPSRLQSIPGYDNHPNEIAHRIAAEGIYAALERREMIPSELKLQFTDHKRPPIDILQATHPRSAIEKDD